MIYADRMACPLKTPNIVIVIDTLDLFVTSTHIGSDGPIHGVQMNVIGQHNHFIFKGHSTITAGIIDQIGNSC